MVWLADHGTMGPNDHHLLLFTHHCDLHLAGSLYCFLGSHTLMNQTACGGRISKLGPQRRWVLIPRTYEYNMIWLSWLCYVTWHTWPQDMMMTWVGLITSVLKNNELSLASGKRGSKRDLKHEMDSPCHCWLCRWRGPHDEESRQLLGMKTSLQVMASKGTQTSVLQPRSPSNNLNNLGSEFSPRSAPVARNWWHPLVNSQLGTGPFCPTVLGELNPTNDYMYLGRVSSQSSIQMRFHSWLTPCLLPSKKP